MALGRGRNRRRNDAATRAADTRAFATRAVFVLWRVTAALGVLAGLVFGGYKTWQWATTSERFALQTVTVAGTVRADPNEVSRLAGLYGGQNLFRLDVPAAVKGAQAHPWVRRAEITRHFPASVSVVVEEHEPAALVALGDLYLLDAAGEPFKRLVAGDALDLPLVTGITREQYMEQPEETAAKFRRALEAMAAYAEAPDADPDGLSEVRVRGGEVGIITRAGVEIRLGEEVTVEKLQRLARVRRELARRNLTAEVIHLDNRARPGWVTVKTATTATERRQASVQ